MREHRLGQCGHCTRWVPDLPRENGICVSCFEGMIGPQKGTPKDERTAAQDVLQSRK